MWLLERPSGCCAREEQYSSLAQVENAARGQRAESLMMRGFAGNDWRVVEQIRYCAERPLFWTILATPSTPLHWKTARLGRYHGRSDRDSYKLQKWKHAHDEQCICFNLSESIAIERQKVRRARLSFNGRVFPRACRPVVHCLFRASGDGDLDRSFGRAAR